MAPQDPGPGIKAAVLAISDTYHKRKYYVSISLSNCYDIKIIGYIACEV